MTCIAEGHGKNPEAQCVACAEKHISYALALSKEAGYVPVNRQRIIGELVAAEIHLYRKWPAMAERVRTLRHCIQDRNEEAADWTGLCLEIEALMHQENGHAPN